MTSFTVTVPTVSDHINESAENFSLSIGGINVVTGIGNITDNDSEHVEITGVAITFTFSNLSIYAGIYLSTSASSGLTGGIMSGTFTSTDVGAKVFGNTLSGNAVTTGAGSTNSGAIALVNAITTFAGSSQQVLSSALV